MTTIRQVFKPALYSLVMAAVLAGCGGGDSASMSGQSSRLSVTTPNVTALSPADLATGVETRTNNGHNLVTGTVVTVTFSQAMNGATLSLADANGLVLGNSQLSTDQRAVTFTPTASLQPNTTYTATLSGASATSDRWTFTTHATGFTAHQPVALGTTGTFAILTKTGVTDVYASAITGDVGASPITGAAIGLTCGEVKGTIFTADAAGPLPCAVTSPSKLTTAVGDMELAYTDAAGRTLPDFTEVGAGEIGGLTLVPGLYKWGTDVLISTDLTLAGGPNDIWIFQIAGAVKQASAMKIILSGGAQAKNVYWQAAGAVSVGTNAHFEGVVLAKTLIAVKTGASVTGRLLAQTAVTLEQNAVTQPAN